MPQCGARRESSGGRITLTIKRAHAGAERRRRGGGRRFGRPADELSGQCVALGPRPLPLVKRTAPANRHTPTHDSARATHGDAHRAPQQQHHLFRPPAPAPAGRGHSLGEALRALMRLRRPVVQSSGASVSTVTRLPTIWLEEEIREPNSRARSPSRSHFSLRGVRRARSPQGEESAGRGVRKGESTGWRWERGMSDHRGCCALMSRSLACGICTTRMCHSHSRGQRREAEQWRAVGTGGRALRWGGGGVGDAHPEVTTRSQRAPRGMRPHVPSSTSLLVVMTWQPGRRRKASDSSESSRKRSKHEKE